MRGLKVPDAVMATEDANPVPLDKDTSKLAGAVTLTLPCRFAPETVNDCSVDAEGVHLVIKGKVVTLALNSRTFMVEVATFAANVASSTPLLAVPPSSFK
jgi:hypothetical protein